MPVRSCVYEICVVGFLQACRPECMRICIFTFLAGLMYEGVLK